MSDAQALDSRAVLGLLAKAHQMFASEGTWLSFPIGTPLAFDAAELVEAMGPAPDAVRHALLAEFSTVTNLIPGGVIWTPSEPTRLDAVVREIVEQGEWAEASRTPAEEARLQADREQVDLQNPEMSQYCSLRDAWIRSRERLANTPDDLDARALERSSKEALTAYPARERIERAMDDLVTLDERAPHRARERFEDLIADGRGTFDDPSGGTFSPVRVLPRAVLTSTGWDVVDMDRAALDSVSAAAPAELSEHLQTSADGADPIESISFEYASAALQRSWFDDAVFRLRCWRFADAGRLISDGLRPGSGECPAYVRGVVFARNVTVRSLAPAGPQPDAPSPHFEALRFMLPEEAVVRRARIDPAVRLGTVGLAPDVGIEVRTPEPEILLDHAIARRAIVRDVAGLGEPALEMRAMPLRMALPSPVVAEAIGVVADAPVTVVQPAAAEAFATPAVLLEAARAPDFALLHVEPVEPVRLPDPTPPGPGLVSQTTPAGVVIVLAFICKAVPKAPDPRPECTWP
jgi:hypothetical protein